MPYKDPETRKVYGRQWQANRRELWIKEHGPCTRCGSWERLEVDHIDPSTKIDHKVWSWAEEKRLLELSKCQVLCYKCHKEKSIKEISKPLIHGTLRCYHSGCRCNGCRQRKSWQNAKRVRVKN